LVSGVSAGGGSDATSGTAASTELGGSTPAGWPTATGRGSTATRGDLCSLEGEQQVALPKAKLSAAAMTLAKYQFLY